MCNDENLSVLLFHINSLDGKKSWMKFLCLKMYRRNNRFLKVKDCSPQIKAVKTKIFGLKVEYRFKSEECGFENTLEQ